MNHDLRDLLEEAIIDITNNSPHQEESFNLFLMEIEKLYPQEFFDGSCFYETQIQIKATNEELLLNAVELISHL